MEERVVVVIPAYNEGTCIQAVVRDLLEHSRALIPLVVNDGSTDDTSARAREAGAIVLDLPVNLGIGGAVQTGFLYALRHRARFVVQVDGDGQHPVEEIDRLLEPLEQGLADLAVGSRFLENGGYRSSRMRRVGIRIISLALRITSGQRFSDPTSGFRAVNRRVLEGLARDYPQDYPEPESLLHAVRKLNARILEVPVSMRTRASGRSSIRGPIESTIYVFKVLLSIFVARIR